MVPTLTDYAQRITQAHEAAAGAMRDAVAHAVEAGELLAQAKAALPHGSFGAFCAGLPFAETTARGYMRLARLDPAKRQRVAYMPLRAALLELAEPRPVQANPGLVIPIGSFGVTMWHGPANMVNWFEVHPVLWPDGETVGLHYVHAVVSEAGDAFCDSSRRPIRAQTVGAFDLARMFHAPIETLRVFEGPPVLWEPPPTRRAEQ